MITFPSTSTDNVLLEKHNYDLKGLITAITAAVKGKVKDNVQPVGPNFFHIHTLSIQCTINPIGEFEFYPDGQRENPDYEAMNNIITAVQDTTEAYVPLTLLPPTPNLLNIPFEPRKGRQKIATVKRWISANVVVPASKQKRPLVELPSILRGQGKSFLHSGTAWDTFNWLHASLALNPSQGQTRQNNYKDDKERIHLRTGIQAVWVPIEGVDIPELKLMITTDAYLNMSLISERLPDIGDELYRMVLSSLIPPELAPPTETGVSARSAALREFYDCLRPAPEFDPVFDATPLQSARLASNLLPFQKRTLALLLHNEGVALAGQGDRAQPSGQWIEIDFEGFGKYAFCRLTGTLQQTSEDRKGKGRASTSGDGSALTNLPTFFPIKDVRGTMLCEEMGLGKTVEAIALILLNRHPLSAIAPLVQTAPDKKTANEVNLIDLPPGHQYPAMRDWLAKEHKAFKHAISWSEESQLNVAEIATTLVVTPLPLLKQWISELATHAPSLRVCVYPGWSFLIQQVRTKRKAEVKAHEKREANKLKRKNTKFRNQTRAKYAKGSKGKVAVEQEDESESEDDSEDEADEVPEDSLDSLLQATQRYWLDYVRSHDVVISIYQTLGDDLKVAHPAPQRSRRSTAKYNLEERPRSPLVMVEWFRVIMDEVQLQGDQSDAANMVSLLPRKNSLAMSGTPARNDVRDLIGSIRFLRVPGVDRTFWNRLLHPDNRPSLHSLFQTLAIRTTKAQVAHEFSLPAQQRFIIPIELSEIEHHYYQDTLERQRERLRIFQDPSVFRTSLRNLRQICTHIQVGALDYAGPQVMERRDRIQLGRQLMTMEEALQKMRADHEATLVDNIKKQMRTMLRKAELIVLDDLDDLRSHKALTLYSRVRDHGQKIIDPARIQLASLMTDREESVELDVDKNASQFERERIKKILTTTSLIRETLLLMHQAWFLDGDAHHVLKEVDQEVEAYDKALGLRKEILARPLKHANTAVDGMCATLTKTSALDELDELLMGNTRLEGAIHTAEAVDKASSLLRILNDNATLVFSWREKIIELLKRPLDAEDNAPGLGEGQEVEDPDKEYYAEALKSQGEVDAYFTAYAAAIADRKEMLLEERTYLEAAEGRVTKKRTTRTAREAAADAIAIPIDDVKDLTDKLMRERQAFRDRRIEEDCTRPLKSLLIEIGNVVHGGYRHEEVVIAKTVASTIRRFVNKQSDYLEKLNKELDLFRATYNKRVTYYACLQEISDSVAPPDFQNLQHDIRKADEIINLLEGTIATNIVKGRYLSFLDNEKKTHDVHEDCPICFGTSEDEFAILLDCGHAFCVSCFKDFRKAHFMGSKCPRCKARIENKTYTKIRIRSGKTPEAEGSGEKEDNPGGAALETEGDAVEDVEEDPEETARLKRSADWKRLKLFDEERHRSIATLDVMGEYGSKITFLIQHLQWSRLTRPETRHVVFSNWADSLNIVEDALTRNRIKYVSFSANTKKNDVVEQFHKDPSISVFLLHAERESAGLTLTSCGVVHLLEPVLQHSFELQAIGRVDRLGQKRETEVYCYATMGTVETRILCQAVRNGTSIYLADQQAGDRAIDSMLNVSSSARSGGDLALNHSDSTGNAELLSLIM